MKAKDFNAIFDEVIATYHIKDTVDQPFSNPHDSKTLTHLLYRKCWIDTITMALRRYHSSSRYQPCRSFGIEAKN